MSDLQRVTKTIAGWVFLVHTELIFPQDAGLLTIILSLPLFSSGLPLCLYIRRGLYLSSFLCRKVSECLQVNDSPFKLAWVPVCLFIFFAKMMTWQNSLTRVTTDSRWVQWWEGTLSFNGVTAVDCSFGTLTSVICFSGCQHKDVVW